MLSHVYYLLAYWFTRMLSSRLTNQRQAFLWRQHFSKFTRHSQFFPESWSLIFKSDNLLNFPFILVIIVKGLLILQWNFLVFIKCWFSGWELSLQKISFGHVLQNFLESLLSIFAGSEFFFSFDLTLAMTGAQKASDEPNVDIG